MVKSYKSETYKGFSIQFKDDYDNIEVRIYDKKRLSKGMWEKIADKFFRVQTKKEGLFMAKEWIDKYY